MKIIQLTGSDGDSIGIYSIEKEMYSTFQEVQEIFDMVIQEAKELQDSEDEYWDLRSHVDDVLQEKYNIVRIFAASVSTNIL